MACDDNDEVTLLYSLLSSEIIIKCKVQSVITQLRFSSRHISLHVITESGIFDIEGSVFQDRFSCKRG